MEITAQIDRCVRGGKHLAVLMTKDNKRDYGRHKNTPDYICRSTRRAEVYSELRRTLLSDIQTKNLHTWEMVCAHINQVYYFKVYGT